MSFSKLAQLTLGDLQRCCSDEGIAFFGQIARREEWDSPYPHVTHSIAASDSFGNKSRPKARACR